MRVITTHLWHHFRAHGIRFGLQTHPAPVMHGSRMDTAEVSEVRGGGH